MITRKLVIGLFLGVFVFVGQASWAGNIALLDDNGVYLSNRAEVKDLKGALNALLAGPNEAESANGLRSAIPLGTKILDVESLENGVIVNLSGNAAEGLDDLKVELIFGQFLWTMKQFGLDEQVRVLIEGKGMASYLSPVAPAIFSAKTDKQALSQPKLSAVGLSGKRITLSCGHGYYWYLTRWTTQRGITCNVEQEDFHNMRFGNYLIEFLENDGAYVQKTREHDFSRGNGPSGHAWWQESAYAWTWDQGYICSVYASSTGLCSTLEGANWNRINDDIRARPLASNLDDRGDTDILVSIHTNALSGDCYGTECPSGGDGFYCDDGGHEPWASQSIDLAQKIQDEQIAAAQAAGFAFYHHGSTGALYGNFGEIRIPERPAALIEIGFHDSCDLDAPLIDDPFFKCCSAWGIYNGICDYFGNTPTYDMYDSEYVSDTIPGSMVSNEVRTVDITFRNKGVFWDEDHAFRLGAIGDSDPFAGHRQYIDGAVTVNTDDTYTFTFDMTAPGAPTTYTTDWKMVRDGHAWFGEELIKQVVVTGDGDTATPTNTPTNTPTATATSPATEIIVDDGDSGYTKSSGWSYSTGAGAAAYNGDYDWTSTNISSKVYWARWTPNLTGAAQYEVYVMYREGANRAIDSPYEVHHKFGTATIDVNQTTNGGTWVLLGTYEFDAGTGGYVELGNGPAEGSKVVIADAVRWYPVGGPSSTDTPTDTPTGEPTNTPTNTPTGEPTNTPTDTPTSGGGGTEVIIDDGDSGYSTSGAAWSYSSGISGAYNEDYNWAGTAASADRWAEWRPDLTGAGQYEVYVMYREGSNRAIDSPYTVSYSGGSETVDVNQTTNGGTWVLLGTYDFQAGTSGYVELANGPAEIEKVVIADAVRWYPVGGPADTNTPTNTPTDTPSDTPTESGGAGVLVDEDFSTWTTGTIDGGYSLPGGWSMLASGMEITTENAVIGTKTLKCPNASSGSVRVQWSGVDPTNAAPVTITLYIRALLTTRSRRARCF